MGKDGDPGGQAMSPKDPKMQAAKVRLLDGTYKDFSLHRGSDGEALFVLVSADLSIEEREYFSLCFYDTEGTRNWLYNDKKILRQLKGLPWEFCYEVKFYPTAPSSLNDDHARYNLFLQLRNDVCSGRLPATIETHATLGALVAQAQYGDAKPTPEYEEYLRTTKFAPQNSEQLLQMIAQKHKEHKGLTPAEAENLYLDTCKQQTMYGIFVFNAKDSKGAPVGIGICAHGIYIYKDQIRVNRFPWQGIIKISYRKNQFAIKLKAGEIDKKEATVVYKVSDYAHAKRIWKTAVEHHTFFRLIQPDEKPKSSLFRWGSARFRYQGRTQFQTKMASQMFDKPSNVTVQRTSSARLTHSLDNVAKEQVGSDHVSPLHYADNELGSREPMASPAVTYEISGQSEKRKLDDKVGNGLPSDDDDELVYTPVESPSSAAYYLSERSSAYSPTTSNDFGRSHQTRLTPLYSWKGSEIASTSADGARYSYNETTGSYSLPYRSGPYSNTFVDTTEKRADIEPLPINDTVQVYHAGHYQRLDRQPRRPPRNADLNNQRINGVTTVRRLGPEEEMNMHPIRYFVNVQHSGSSHIPRVSRIRHPGREEVGAPNLSNYNFRSSSDSPIVRLEPGNELEARNIRQYSSVYHPGSSQIVVSKQSDPEMPPPRLITRVLPTASLDGHFRPLSDGDGVPKAHNSRAQRNENIDGTEREQFSTPSTSPAGRFKESSRERIHDSYFGKGEAILVGRRQHDSTEEAIEKKRARPEVYGVASTSSTRHVEPITPHSELPSVPLGEHTQAYHHGQSWDVTKGAKAHIDSATNISSNTGKKAVLHLKGSPVKKKSSPADEEEAPEVRLIARVPHKVSEGKTVEAERKYRDRTHQGEIHSQHPVPDEVAAPLQHVDRQAEIEQMPFRTASTVPSSTTTSKPTQHRAYVFERYHHDGGEEFAGKEQLRPADHGVASKSDKGSLESTPRQLELKTTPLREHAEVYHHGQSWVLNQGAKTVPAATTEDHHGTTRREVPHTGGTVVKSMPSLVAEEETSKIHLITRIPPATAEQTTNTVTPSRAHELTGMYSVSKPETQERHASSLKYSDHPNIGKSTFATDYTDRQVEFKQIPLKVSTAVTDKPAADMGSQPVQHRAYVFGRWRHDGDEEVVEKDRVRPESYRVVTTSYKGPLESTTLHSELPSAPLRDHAKVYHHGQSWDETKTVKTPTTSTTEVTGKKAVLHLKGTPEKDMPSPSVEEGAPKVRLIARVSRRTSEDDEANTNKPMKEHKSSGLFSFWKSGGRKRRVDLHDGSEYPITGKYAGPLDQVNRQRDIEQIPFKAPTPVTYKPTPERGSETAQHRAYVFGRWRHDGDEEIVEKDRVRPETYGVASTSYKGPLESTTLHSELPSAPLRDHAKVYHHGQSWDVAKTAKFPTAVKSETDHGTGRKAVLHLKRAPEQDMPSPSAEEEAPKVRLIARVPHRTSEDDEALTSKPTKDHESSGLFSFWKSGERKHRGDSYDGSEHPVTGKYAGPLDEVNRQRDIEQIPFKAPTPVTYKPTPERGSETAQPRAYVFGRWRHDGDEEIVEKDRVQPETYGVASTSYKGPLESTTLHSELPSAPLRDHAKVYHRGQSWEVAETEKTPTAVRSETDHGTGRKAVLHLKRAPEQDMPSPSAEEEAPKVRLVTRVPHRTSEDDEAITSKPTKDHKSSGLFSFWKSGGRKHGSNLHGGSEYPFTGKYAGPLDEVNRQRDIEQIPFNAPTPSPYKPASGTTSERKQRHAYVFERQRHGGDEEIVEKDRVRSETYGLDSTSHEGALESTSRHSELPSAPLREHAQVYHRGQSWDVTKTGKTSTAVKTEVDQKEDKKAALHLRGRAVKEDQASVQALNAEKDRGLSGLSPSTSGEKTDSSEQVESRSGSRPFAFWKSGSQKREEAYENPEHLSAAKNDDVQDTIDRYGGTSEDRLHISSRVSDRKILAGSSGSTNSRTYLFRRWRRGDSDEVVEHYEIGPATSTSSTSYEGFSELAGCPSKYSSNLKDDIHATLRGQAVSTVSNAASSNKDGVIAQERSEDRKHPSWTRSWDVQRPTIHKEAVTSYLQEDSSRHDLSTDSEHAIPVACSHTGRLEGRTMQGDEWVEVRVDRRAEVQLEPVLCLTGAGLRDLSEDEAGMIFSVTPPMPSSDRSFFSRLGFKSSAQKPKKQKKGKKETDSSDSSSSSEDEKNQIQVIPVESGGVTLPHYVDPDEKDGRVVRRETNELKYRLKGEGISPNFDPQNPSLASTMAKAERLNLRSPRLEHAERTVTVRALAPLPLSYEESGQPHTTISTWQESSRLPDEVTTEYDEKGNKITRTLKTSQVKHTVQKQTFQNYVVPTDEQPGVVTVEHIREETTPLSAAAVATNGSAGSPHVVETHSRTVAYDAGQNEHHNEALGEFVSCKTLTSGNRTVETYTYKTERDGIIETHVEHRVTIHSDEPIDHDAELSHAIMEATQMNPDMTVEKIEVRQESTA